MRADPEHLRLKIFVFNRGVAVTSPRSGTGAAKRGLPACSARASALAAAERLSTIHWENALKRHVIHAARFRREGRSQIFIVILTRLLPLGLRAAPRLPGRSALGAGISALLSAVGRSPPIQKLHALSTNFCSVAILPLLILPFSGLQIALDLD